ncbi:hypothetical protein Aduo_008985 [Ancylostoma duodenale]
MITEIGAPEASFQFYGTYCGVGNARYLYDEVRRRTPAAMLAEMNPPPPRTSAPRKGGISSRDHDHDHDVQVGGKRRMLDHPRRV